jgi:hypothetical protein
MIISYTSTTVMAQHDHSAHQKQTASSTSEAVQKREGIPATPRHRFAIK